MKSSGCASYITPIAWHQYTSPVITLHQLYYGNILPRFAGPSTSLGLLSPEGLGMRLDMYSDMISMLVLNKAKPLWKWFEIQCTACVYTATKSTWPDSLLTLGCEQNFVIPAGYISRVVTCKLTGSYMWLTWLKLTHKFMCKHPDCHINNDADPWHRHQLQSCSH